VGGRKATPSRCPSTHANVGVTLDTYSHVTMPMQAEAASLVAGLIPSKITNIP
jgi:hypothetical protein